MANVKNRLAKLEATMLPKPTDLTVTEIHRVIHGRFNADGSPVIHVRHINPALPSPAVAAA